MRNDFELPAVNPREQLFCFSVSATQVSCRKQTPIAYQRQRLQLSLVTSKFYQSLPTANFAKTRFYWQNAPRDRGCVSPLQCYALSKQ